MERATQKVFPTDFSQLQLHRCVTSVLGRQHFLSAANQGRGEVKAMAAELKLLAARTSEPAGVH